MGDDHGDDEALDDLGSLDTVLQAVARAEARPVPGGLIAGRFRIAAVAGRGGFGTVYRARDEASNQDVALKVLRSETTDALRFEREAAVLATVRHPHVVSYIAHGFTEDGAPYLAMEWLEGLDLAHRLYDEALSTEEALTMALGAARGLGAAHALGIVHRDVKPSNLYLVGSRCEEVRVLDFGVARTPASALTATGALVGTPAYMAPEQARGERELSPRVDVFALGCVLFECLTGALPFAAPDAATMLTRLMVGDAPRLRERDPDAPARLDALLGRMLAHAPAERMADAAAAASEIAAVLEELFGSALGEPAAGLGDRFRSTLLVQTAPWRVLPAVLPLLTASLGGALFERSADAAIVTFASEDASDGASQAARCALQLRDQDRSLRLGIATARRATPQAVVDEKLLQSLVASAPGDVLVDKASARYLEAEYELEPRGAMLAIGPLRAPRKPSIDNRGDGT